MSTRQYSEPLQKLFELSKSSADPYKLDEYDFLAMGMTAEHIPELTKLILEEEYYISEDQDLGSPQLFAYQALGQLKTEAAIEALVQGTQRWSESDWFEWFTEAMPAIFRKIGCPAVPSVVGLLQDATAHMDARSSAVDYLEAIGTTHPECRDLCVQVLTDQLQRFNENHPTLNGFIVTALAIDFKAVESVAVIEQAYQADRVDKKVLGDWDDAQVYLGLKSPAELPPGKRRKFWGIPEFETKPLGFSNAFRRDISAFFGEFSNLGSSSAKVFNQQKAKAKRQHQKQARRKNRRKK
jgi:hypothetical protein